MTKKFNFAQLAIFLLGVFTFYSCERESSITDTQLENLVIEAQEDIQVQTRSGGGECFELVWPISIQFSDESIVEINEHADIKVAVIAWKTDNPDKRPNVRVVYPIDIITSDGTMVTIESRLELKEIKRECIGNGHHDKRPCFRLVYPLSLVFPDGAVKAFDSRIALRHALRAWKKNNPTSTDRPHLSYPITVKLKDGSTLEVANKEALIKLKKDC